MKPDDLVRLRHMVEAAQIVADRQRSDLHADLTLRFAVVRAIEIFGEGASRLSPEAREAAPQIPWSAIIGMRNRLVHPYFDIDHDIVWTTAT